MRFKILLFIFVINQFSEISGSTDQFTTIQVNHYGVNRNVLLQKIVCSSNSFFVKLISRKISWKWISRKTLLLLLYLKLYYYYIFSPPTKYNYCRICFNFSMVETKKMMLFWWDTFAVQSSLYLLKVIGDEL